MSELSRRQFFQAGGAGVGALLILGATGGRAQAAAAAIPLKKRIGEKTSICAYCAGGCGILVATEGDRLVSIEGDADHPVNRGVLCSKAQSMFQVRTVDGKLNPRRLTKVLYRAPNSSAWEEKTWDWALTEIAARVKKTRDASFVEKDKDGITVNRTEAIAQLGGSACDNEEAYLISKMNRGLGLVYTETQARI
jgi:formate dehydrogenase major subunit